MKLEVDNSLLKNDDRAKDKHEHEREMRLKELFHRTKTQWLEILEEKTYGTFEMRWDEQLNGIVLYNQSIKRGLLLHTQYAHTIGEGSIERVIYFRNAFTSGFISKFQEPLKDALSYIKFPKELHEELEQLLFFSIDRRKNLSLYCRIFNNKIAKL